MKKQLEAVKGDNLAQSIEIRTLKDDKETLRKKLEAENTAQSTEVHFLEIFFSL